LIVPSGRLALSVDYLQKMADSVTPTVGPYRRLQKLNAFVGAVELKI
jgi:hypothetical protein